MKLALGLTEEDPVVREVEAEDPIMVAGAVIKIGTKPLKQPKILQNLNSPPTGRGFTLANPAFVPQGGSTRRQGSDSARRH